MPNHEENQDKRSLMHFEHFEFSIFNESGDNTSVECMALNRIRIYFRFGMPSVHCSVHWAALEVQIKENKWR